MELFNFCCFEIGARAAQTVRELDVEIGLVSTFLRTGVTPCTTTQSLFYFLLF